MEKTYKANVAFGGKEHFFILSRLCYGKTKVENAIKNMARGLSHSFMEASDLKKFETWLRQSIKELNDALAVTMEIKLEIRPDGIDCNGKVCREYFIYRMRNGCPQKICNIYLYETNLTLSFKEGGSDE